MANETLAWYQTDESLRAIGVCANQVRRRLKQWGVAVAAGLGVPVARVARGRACESAHWLLEAKKLSLPSHVWQAGAGTLRQTREVVLPVSMRPTVCCMERRPRVLTGGRRWQRGAYSSVAGQACCAVEMGKRVAMANRLAKSGRVVSSR